MKSSTKPTTANTLEMKFLKRDAARVIQVLLDQEVCFIFLDEFRIGSQFMSPCQWAKKGKEGFLYANNVQSSSSTLIATFEELLCF